MAIIKNLTLDQGSTFSVRISITGANNEAYDLTNYTATAQMKKNAASVSSINFTTSFGVLTAGEVFMSLTDEESTVIKAGRYLYDLVVEDTITGEKYRAVEGIVTVTAGITSY
jgi:hypothetical protein|tara:strand:+ start:1107 stop:1445 length:339 start_codon:yes stop_codon:yes gene_type:complete